VEVSRRIRSTKGGHVPIRNAANGGEERTAKQTRNEDNRSSTTRGEEKGLQETKALSEESKKKKEVTENTFEG